MFCRGLWYSELMPLRSGKITAVHGITLLVLLVWAFSITHTAAEKDGLLRVYFMNVGQGDAIFIQAPNGNQLLIDGGPDNTVISELGQVMPFYDHDIDVVMASHPHSDHISGLVEVLRRYDIRTIIEAKESYDSPQFKAWKDAVADEHSQEVEAVSGTDIDLGNGAVLSVLHPFRSVAGTATKKPHDDMVAAMLKYGKTKILFTGDMEAPVEKALMGRGAGLDADVLKVGHHGSKTSTGEEFLSAVSPQVAVIEVGAKNRYRHPASSVLERLENSGISYYRTDTDGHMELVSDGERFRISKY